MLWEWCAQCLLCILQNGNFFQHGNMSSVLYNGRSLRHVVHLYIKFMLQTTKQTREFGDCVSDQLSFVKQQNIFSSKSLPAVLFFLKQVNQQATAPMHGDPAALWTSAASKAVSCGAWRCTVHLPRLASLLALCVHSATQTCREHPRLVPQGTKWTRAQSVGQHSSQTRQKTRR